MKLKQLMAPLRSALLIDCTPTQDLIDGQKGRCHFEAPERVNDSETAGGVI